MPATPKSALSLSAADARRIWIRAQRLDAAAPFGNGPDAIRAAVEHLGYVQIDTINVVERCHHHILWSRIPGYRRAHLRDAQAVDKTVFEYWTHALAYVPTRDFRFFMPEMRRRRAEPDRWFASVDPKDVRRLIARIRGDGPLSIRDIDDDELVEKDHAWASRKPSKRALQLAFMDGRLTVGARDGMVKSYELTDRHFGWEERPKPASERQVLDYMLDRALRAQGIVSLDSICHLDAPRKPAIGALLESRVRQRRVRLVAVEGSGKVEHWASVEALDAAPTEPSGFVHILSPFDPLVIQRKRLAAFFGYDHRFEAYVPKEKRLFGYFALPVMVDDEIVAAIDIKADREGRTLLIRQWTWVGRGCEQAHGAAIEAALHRYQQFQFGA